MRSSHKSYRNHALLIVFLIFLPVVVVGGFNYIVDPLQIYRKQQWVEPRFWSDQRSQNAGKIRSYLTDGSYDSIIIGNSVTDNFRPSQVAKRLGWKKTLKLTVDGGRASEQAFMLEQALETGKIRHVLWCNRVANIQSEKADAWHPRRAIPFFLYSRTLLDDGAYLFSLDTFDFSRDLMRRKLAWEQDLDQLNYWQSEAHIDRQVKYNSPQNLKKLDEATSAAACPSDFIEKTKARYPCLEKNLLNMIRKYPQVEFIVLLAPQTRQSLVVRNRVYLQRYFGVQRYLVKKTRSMSNVKIFGFETKDQIVNNIANYRDNHHYHSGVNDYMLRAVAKGNNSLTTTSIDAYLNAIQKKLCSFKIYSNFETMLPLALPEENALLAQALDKQAITSLLGDADALIRKGTYSDALNLLNQIIIEIEQKGVVYPQVFASRANLHFRMGDPTSALGDYDKAIELDPQNVGFYAERGQIKETLKDFKSAAADYMKFISKKTYHFRGYWLLGRLRAKEGELDEAIRLFSRSIELNPQKLQPYRDRGKAYARKGDPVSANRDFKMAKRQGADI